MFINNFISEKIYEKRKKRRIRTWDLQHTDLALYAQSHEILTDCVYTQYNSNKKL